MPDFKTVTNCRVCGSDRLKRYLDLGKVPPANSLLQSEHSESVKYPLEVLFCEECSLSQLSVVVPPEILYGSYPYNSSVSETFKKHCYEMAKFLKGMTTSHKPSVVDIASNDGCLLEQFKKCNYYVNGVEPCLDLAEKSNAKGIATVNDFWNERASSLTPACDIITATNVLAHVDDVKSFIGLAKKNLRVASKGFMVVEVPYLSNILKSNQFDTIYHEHLSYFLFKPLKILFESCGMKVFRVEQHDIHGGSLRVYASPYERDVHQSVEMIENFESFNKLHEFQTYIGFAQKVTEAGSRFKDLLKDLALEGKKVMGYGASAKGASLMNYCDITQHEVESILDDTKEKQGKFIPGCRIPIVDKSHLEKSFPDYLVLFSWNFAWELISNTKTHKERGGKYIIPIPQVCIL